MQTKVVKDNIVVFRGSQLAVSSAMLRFQEHYESPEWAGKIFTLGQFRQWYTDTYGGFTYYSDWGGFNWPDTVSKPFLQGLFDPLTRGEEEVLDVIRNIGHSFYVIATCSSSEDLLFHELCHATFYLNSDYKNEVLKALKAHEEGIFRAGLQQHLLELGYCEKTLDDELNAYIVASHGYLKEQGIKVPKPARKELSALAKTYVDPTLKVADKS